jgi:hypothetical protein
MAIRIIKWILISLSVSFLIIMIALRYGLINFLHEYQPFEIIGDMDNQVKITPQKESRFYKDGSSSRKPVENTVPKYGTKYHFIDLEFEEAEASIKNPLEPTEFVINRGKNRFEIFCTPCHGFDGRGKGTMITKANLKPGEEGFPVPADLMRERTRNLADQRIFHILSAGQNLMFQVTFKLTEEDRWAIVHYLRRLQSEKKISP